MEKRFFRRVNVNGGMCTLIKDGIYTGTVGNISLGGLFVTSDMQLTVMDRTAISITLPSDSRTIDIETDVIATRVEKNGIAFKYDRLNPKDFWTLQSFIQGSNPPLDTYR